MRNYLREMMDRRGPLRPEGDLETAHQGLATPDQKTWEIRVLGDDQFEIWCGRRFTRDFTTEREAERYVNVVADPHDLVYVVEKDGYRRLWKGKRRGWRR